MSPRPSSRTEARKRTYKTGVDADEARGRREENLVEMRKNKREDNLLKKRRDGILLRARQVLDASNNAASLESRTHDDNEIYEKAVKILERYWAEEEEENQDVQNGGEGNQQGFSFGSPGVHN